MNARLENCECSVSRESEYIERVREDLARGLKSKKKVFADLGVNYATRQRRDGRVKSRRDLSKPPPISASNVTIVDVPLRLHLFADDPQQVGPSFRLFERHLSETDHVSFEELR